MAATTRCPSCGATGGATDDTCAFCGATPAEAATGPGDADPEAPAVAPGAAPGEPAPPAEARRLQGLAVPVVAALVVIGIGFPLTALAVAQVGRLPATATPPPSSGGGASALGTALGAGSSHARLAGSVTFDGPAAAIGCSSGPPRLVTFSVGTDLYSVLLSAPTGAGEGSYDLQTAKGAFVAVSRLVSGGQTWTSLGRAGASGALVVSAGRSVSARFTGLEASGGGAKGTVDGSVEAHCA